MNQQTTETLVLGYQTMINLEQLAAYLAVAFDFETSPKTGYQDQKKAALDPHHAEITAAYAGADAAYALKLWQFEQA